MKAKFSSSKTFDEAQKFQKAPKPDELVDVLPPAPRDWQGLRFVGPLVAVGGHWLNTEPPVQGKKTKAFYKPCRAFNPETEERDSTIKCPYCEDDSGWIRPDLVYWQNAIVQSLEEDAPEKKGKRTDKEKDSGFKEKGSKAWTPVRAVRLTAGTVRELKKLSLLNRHKNKKTGEKQSYPLSDEKKGAWVNYMYDPDEKTPSKKYSVQMGDKSALDEDQQEYLMWNIEVLVKPEKDKEAEAEYKRWKKMAEKAGLADGGGSDDDDEDEDRMKSKSKKSSGKKSKSRDEDDESEDEDEDDEDEDNEFKSDKKKSKKSKKSAKDDDDDEDEDEDDEDDEDEDDEPKSKKSKKSKSSKKKKSKKSRDDDEDEDEDDDD